MSERLNCRLRLSLIARFGSVPARSASEGLAGASGWCSSFGHGPITQALACCCATILVLYGAAPARAQLRPYLPLMPTLSQPTPESDPLPLRRIELPPERILRELERARQGALVHLTREEFEARVRQAQAVGEALKKPPRLLEARYRAVLEGSSLVGTGQWEIVNPATMAGVLPIQPFNLALRGTRLDKTAAVLGELDGKALGLLVEQPGKHCLKLDWSARGESGPAGLRFRLEVPACALTSFELDLPADLELVAVLDRVACLLSGPHASATEKRRLWRVACAEASPVDLLIRPAAGAAFPLLLATSQTRQNLGLDSLLSEFDLGLEILHGSIHELSCECDPGLRPVSVSIRNLAIQTWELHPPAKPGSPAILNIRLPEPFQGKAPLVQVRCVSTLAPGERWHSPGLHVAGAMPRGETLLLHLAPEVELQGWEPGHFELTKSAAETDGGQILTLQSGLRDPAATHRPASVVRRQESETRIRQLTWWKIQPTGSTLTVQLTYDVSRGRRFRLPVILPAGWEVERVDLYPTGLLQNWNIMPAPDKASLLVVELQRALKAPGSARVTIELRAQRDGRTPGNESHLSFPLVSPTDTRQWEGALAISIDSSLQGVARASASADAIPSFREREASDHSPPASRDSSAHVPPLMLPAWNAQPPDFYYTFRSQPITGSLQLRPRPPRFHARTKTEVGLTPGRAALRTRLLLEPILGNVDTIDVALSAPMKEHWQWKSESPQNGVRTMEHLRLVEETSRLLALGGGSALAVADLLALPAPPESVWRLKLAQPLHEPLVLEVTSDLNDQTTPPSSRSPSCWQVPLLTVLNADRITGEIRLLASGTERMEIQSSGLREVGAQGGPENVPVWRSFRYGHGRVALTLHGRVTANDRLSQVHADRVELETYVEPGGRLLNRFQFQIENWQQGALPVRLPAGARLWSARVDGRWVDQPDVIESPEGNLIVGLPVPAGGTPHLFEAVYAIDGSGWRLWTRLSSPAPVLPVPAEGFRRIWHLPAGLAPVDEGQLQRLPGIGRISRDQAEAAENARSAFSIISSFAEAPAGEWRIRQQNMVAAANSREPKSPSKLPEETLQDILEDLVFNVFEGREPVVVDALALEEMRLRLNSPLKRRLADDSGEMALSADRRLLPLISLEGTGLVCLASPSGPLLTTQRQWESWLPDAGQEAVPTESIGEAIAEAARYGQDSSGRFHRVVDWLRRQGIAPTRTTVSASSFPSHEDCTSWEPLSGDPSQETLLVIRPAAFSALSWALTCLFLLAAWKKQTWPGRIRYGLLIVWSGLGAMMLLWVAPSLRGLVWVPLLPSITLGCLWYLWLALRRANLPQSAKPVTTAGALLALAAAACLPGQAAAPAPQTVWLLPGPGGATSKQTVLAPPGLLEQLDMLGRRGAQGFHGAGLLGAEYAGAIRNGLADFKANFQIHSFNEGSTLLALPLGGIELQEATLDGSEAYPVPLPAPSVGYTLPIKGRGRHQLQLRFAIRVADSGAERELRCMIPEIAQSRLKLVVPAGATFVQTLNERGAQRTTSEPRGIVLEADLGRINSLQVHWRLDSAPPPTEKVYVNEMYLWDLRSPSNVLHGVLQYAVREGPATSLAIALPPSMEINQIRTSPVPGGPAAPRLRGWRVVSRDNQRVLELQFQTPITASVQVYLDLVSSQPLAPNVALALPAPLHVLPAAADSYVGFRIEGHRAEPVEFNRVTGIQPEVFNLVWQSADSGERGTAAQRAYRFRRTAAGGPVLRLRLHSPAPQTMCLQNLVWHVGMQNATVQGTANLRAPKEQFSLIDWLVPLEVTVTSVSGPEVRSWARNGARIQVWLRRSVKEATLELTGWLSRPADKPGQPFALPCVNVAAASPHWTTIRILADNDVALKVAELQHLWPSPAWRLSARDRTYFTQQTDYNAVLQVTPAQAHATARIVTVAETRERALTFSSMIDYVQREGELQTVGIRLRNWQGSRVRLQAPHVSARHERQLGGSTTLWTLDLQPGVTGHYAIKLTGSLPLDSAAEVLMPDVSVERLDAVDRFLVTAGSDVLVEEPRGLAAVAGVTVALQPWPTLRDHLAQVGGSVWKVAAEDWTLRLQPRSSGAGQKPARLFYQEYTAAVRDGLHWEHVGSYWLAHEAATEINIVLPAGARLIHAALDGIEVKPVQTERERVSLPLAGGGIRQLRLTWHSDDAAGAIDRLDVGTPRLEDGLHMPLPRVAKSTAPLLPRDRATNGTAEQIDGALWTIQIPPGYRLAASQAGLARVSVAAQELGRAAAMLEISRELSDPARDKSAPSAELAAAQEQFYRFCRYAQERLTLPEEAGPGSVLSAGLFDLKKANQQLAKAGGFERVRVEAEKKAGARPDGPFFRAVHDSFPWKWTDTQRFAADRGTPTIWRVTNDLNGPRLQLVSSQIEQRQRAIALSVLIGLLCLVAWLVTYTPRLVTLLQALWPEQIALLGYLGWQTLGPHVGFVVLFLFAAAGRIFCLARWISGLAGRPAAPSVATDDNLSPTA